MLETEGIIELHEVHGFTAVDITHATICARVIDRKSQELFLDTDRIHRAPHPYCGRSYQVTVQSAERNIKVCILDKDHALVVIGDRPLYEEIIHSLVVSAECKPLPVGIESRGAALLVKKFRVSSLIAITVVVGHLSSKHAIIRALRLACI